MKIAATSAVAAAIATAATALHFLELFDLRLQSCKLRCERNDLSLGMVFCLPATILIKFV